MDREPARRRAPFLGCLTPAPAQVGLRGSYLYRRRGTRELFFPDLTPDAGGTSGEIAFEQGSLCAGDHGGPDGRFVAWKAQSVLDFGVDVLVRFEEEVFAGLLVVRQDRDRSSALAGIEVFSQEPGSETPAAVGRADAGVTGVVEAGRIDLPLGVRTRELLVRLHACYRPIVLRGLTLWGATGGAPSIYPIPERYETTEGEPFDATSIRAVVVPRGATEDALFAGRLFAEKLGEELRATPPDVGSDAAQSRGPAVLVEQAGDPGEPERFTLSVEAAGAVVRASGRRGLVYGIEALLSLIRGSAPDHAVRPCRIDDRPAMEIRGIHMGLPPREEIPFCKRLVRSLLVPMRYNTVFLEFAGGMELDRRPEINRAWIEANRRAESGERPPFPHGNMVAGGRCLSKAEVRDLVASMRQFGLDVIPEVQSLSHVQYLTVTYPHIAEREPPREGEETSAEKADALPDELYPHCYCPSLDESLRIVYDLIDEIVEVVQPTRYVHMGHDEVYTIGACERCRDTSPADLYAGHVRKMRDYLAGKGLRMMIWSDMLQSCTRYQTPPAIDHIPRDVVMLDFIWYFHLDKDIEDGLLERGFRLVMGNMYSSHYPRYAARRRKRGVVGAEVSTWLRVDEYTLATEGKLYDMLYSAAMMWWDGYRDELRRCLDALVTELIPGVRESLRGRPSPSRAAGSSFVCLPLPPTPREPSLAAVLPRGTHCLRGVPFSGGGPVVVRPAPALGSQGLATAHVAVDGCFDSLVFLHATTANAARTPWRPLARIAGYIIRFADDTLLDVPVEYGGAVAPLFRPHGEPMASPIYRHQGYVGTYLADPFLRGKSPRGEDLTLYGFEWINPYPERQIREVDVAAADEGLDCGLALFALTGCRAPRPAESKVP